MFAHFVFLCHILVILLMFQTVFIIIMFIVICDQWSLILLLQHAEAQMMVNIFSNKVFFNWAMYIFLDMMLLNTH